MINSSMMSRAGRALRNFRRESALGRLIGQTPVRTWVRELYEGLILRRGTHNVEILGNPLVFSVPTREVLARLDNVHNEREFLERLVAHLEPDDLVYDIGANIGVFSMAIAASGTLRSPAQIVAFEPEPTNFEVLTKSATLNNLPIRSHQLALGNTDGDLPLYLEGTTGSGKHSFIEKPAPSLSENDVITVPMQQIDNLPTDIPLPTVLKIDVEGFEQQVLLGAQKVLSNATIREIFVEIHPHKGVDAQKLQDYLVHFDMQLVWERSRGRETHQHYQRPISATGTMQN